MNGLEARSTMQDISLVLCTLPSLLLSLLLSAPVAQSLSLTARLGASSSPWTNHLSSTSSFPSPLLLSSSPATSPAFISSSVSSFSSSPSSFQTLSPSLRECNASSRTRRAGLSGLRASASDFDCDVAIVGCGVGGHGAALHSVGRGLKTVVLTGGDAGGTCVNRGCVPSKALLAAAGRVREMREKKHLEALGIVPGEVKFDRAGIAAHADNLATKVRGGLLGSLKGIGAEVREERAIYGREGDAHVLQLIDKGGNPTGKTLRAKSVILAPGSVPFVPRGIEVDEKTVFTSDGGLKLPSVPQWMAIIGSGYIGLEFADVFTALGTEVTFIEAMDKLMPTFDPDIAKVADRLLIQPRSVDSRTGVFASEVTCGVPGKKPVTIKLIDAKTKRPVETLQVDACMVATGRTPSTTALGLENLGVELAKGNFVPVDAHMRVIDAKGNVIPDLYCIGDANGKLMLAHAASAQGVSAVENILGHGHTVNHEHIPAACFTHPEIAFVGLTEKQAMERGKMEGFEVGKAVSHFRGNSKALAEGEGDGIAKVMYRKDTGKLLGVHIIGMHASDLIQECSNAMAAGTTVKELSFMVHTHPTLSEVLDAAFKQAVGMAAH